MTRRDYAGAVLTLTGALTVLAAVIIGSPHTTAIGLALIAAGLITLNERQDS